MAYFEVTMRLFFRADEGDVVPARTIAVEPSDIPNTDWTKAFKEFETVVRKDMAIFPMTNVHEMTDEEVNDYLARENDQEEPEPVTLN